MLRKLLMFVLVLAMLLMAASPAFAKSNSAKNLCKGVTYTLTAQNGKGEVVYETIYLNWQVVNGKADDGSQQPFRNQGACVSYVAQGGVLSASCDLLQDSDIRASVGCFYGRPLGMSWIPS